MIKKTKTKTEAVPKKTDNALTLTLPDVRLAFPYLFTKDPGFGPESSPKYATTFLIPKASPVVGLVQEAFVELATRRWADDARSELASLIKADRTCLHDGGEKSYDGFADHYYIRSSSQHRPLCLARDRSAVTAEDGLLYSGCWVVASIEIYLQDNQYGKRLNCGLRGVQFRRHGDAFSGGSIATIDDFEVLPEDDSESAGGDIVGGSSLDDLF